MWCLKCKGFVDVCFVQLFGVFEKYLCKKCWEMGVKFVYKCVDICVVEFVIIIVYMYFIYEEECEVVFSGCDKIMVLGGGFN